MANQEHFAKLKQGVVAWNEWRVENPHIEPSLSETKLSHMELLGANLSRVNLKSARLHKTDLHRVNLSYANLFQADLSKANLSGAELLRSDLNNANLFGADLSASDLSIANLRGAYLEDANLGNANLENANLSLAHLIETEFSGASLRTAYLWDTNFSRTRMDKTDLAYANLRNTVFADVDLSGVKGLEIVQHSGPSTIGLDTIYRSRGKIPESFLRLAGAPENFIVYMHSLTVKAFDYYSCFISHSSKDQKFAKLLHAGLQQEGVRCWYAPEDLKTGDKFRQRIDEAIRIYDKLLVVLSENSIRSSWVEDEVEGALEKERRENKLALFPIRLDNAVIKTEQAWAASLRRTRHIADFTKWKDHDFYQNAFKRLLRDLQGTDTAKASRAPGRTP